MTTKIPLTALLSLAFFDEKLGILEMIGALLIFAAVIAVSATRIFGNEEEEEEVEDDNDALGVEEEEREVEEINMDERESSQPLLRNKD